MIKTLKCSVGMHSFGQSIELGRFLENESKLLTSKTCSKCKKETIKIIRSVPKINQPGILFNN